ncbi:pentapeptide repeat-containing protein [Terrisporobacter glycolicus]|uniref:pentapeptide repeat-containing protein n=1 Tax=Terrisporobacter glycolicus TaxID=36841 RepID=UPI0034644AB2
MNNNKKLYTSLKYNKTSKMNKNFMYQDLKRSNCYNCDFSKSNFNFTSLRGAHFKSCNFYGCTFKSSEFVGSNLKVSKFTKAKFEDTIFEGSKLESVDFSGATFKNVIFVNSDLSKVKNLNYKEDEVKIYNEMPELEISDDLKKAIEKAMENKCVKKSRTLDTKDGNINTISVMILLEKFREKRLIEGLGILREKVDRDFWTLSYIIKSLQSYKDQGIL